MAMSVPTFDIETVRYLSDREWLDLHLRWVGSNGVVERVRLPFVPSDDLQRAFVGSAGEPALREGFRFYEVCKQYVDRFGINITDDTRVLDFGMGFGRMMRFWLRDVRSYNLYGVDVDPEMVDLCRHLFGVCHFSTVHSYPPSPFPDVSFDFIYAYSVFSHLCEDAAAAWVKEFARILKPGGLVVATTHSRRFIEFCASLRGKELESLWHQALAKSFVDTEASLATYDHGGFLYAPNGGGAYRDASFYGDALFSMLYIERHWMPVLEPVEFIDEEHYLPQACFVLKKRRTETPVHALRFDQGVKTRCPSNSSLDV